MKQYKTIYKESQTEIIEKKSRFIAHVKPIKTEDEAVDFINQLKSKYWDATHNVYAYSLMENGIQRYSDDGEPQGTAGIPTLQAIKNLDLNDVVAVITRYFGGTLLGASGLVRAYNKSAKEGLVEGEIVTKKFCKNISVTIDYSFLGKLQSKSAELGFIVSNIIYEDNVKVEILLGEEEIALFNKTFADIVGIEADIKQLGNKIVIVDGGKLLEICE